MRSIGRCRMTRIGRGCGWIGSTRRKLPDPVVGNLGTMGTLVAAESRRDGQYGDFRMDDSLEARIAWKLVKDRTLPAFSVYFLSIDPPHQLGAGGQGRVREAVMDTVALTDKPAYKTAALAEARERHPLLDDETVASMVVPDRSTFNPRLRLLMERRRNR